MGEPVDAVHALHYSTSTWLYVDQTPGGAPFVTWSELESDVEAAMTNLDYSTFIY